MFYKSKQLFQCLCCKKCQRSFYRYKKLTKQELLITIDRTTNELVSINKDVLNPPVSVNGTFLTQKVKYPYFIGVLEKLVTEL